MPPARPRRGPAAASPRSIPTSWRRRRSGSCGRRPNSRPPPGMCLSSGATTPTATRSSDQIFGPAMITAISQADRLTHSGWRTLPSCCGHRDVAAKRRRQLQAPDHLARMAAVPFRGLAVDRRDDDRGIDRGRRGGRRRSQGRSLMLRKPSMTIWHSPRGVSVSGTSSATANRALRPMDPQQQQLVGVADVGVPSCHVPSNVARPCARMTALMRAPTSDATVESIVATASLHACPRSVSRSFRVWTMDECRSRLYGVTVAPTMPTAM